MLQGVNPIKPKKNVKISNHCKNVSFIGLGPVHFFTQYYLEQKRFLSTIEKRFLFVFPKILFRA